MRKLTLALSLVAVSSLAFADDEPFPGIEKLMSDEEFGAAGLEKLNPQERAALNQWLISYTIDEGPVIRRTNSEVKEAEKAIQIMATIKQPFKGWSGETMFYMDNGQVWKQRLAGRYHHSHDSSEVLISKNIFGFYKMTMTSNGKSVGVSRIR